MRRILTWVRHLGGGAGRSTLVLMLVLAGGLQGCASWKPEGARGLDDTIPDSALRDLPRVDARVLVLVDPGNAGRDIAKTAEGFFGGSCEISFRLYPELYLQTYRKLSALYAQVDIAETGGSAADYDLVVSPGIDDVRWSAGGLSANLAAVDAYFQLRGQPGLQDVRAHQLAKGELGRIHNGCDDAAISALRGARAAVGLAVNRMMIDLSRQNVRGTARAATRGPDPAQAALLARLEAGRGQAGGLKSQQDYSGVIAAGLDVAGATFDLQGQGASARAARQLAQGLRSTGSALPDASGASHMAGMGSSALPPGSIPVPAAAADASCQGDFTFLGPHLRDYSAPELADIRRRMLTASMPDTMAALRAQGGTGAAAVLRQQAAGNEQTAAEAARQAQSSDGHGDASIPMARADTLPLNFSCADGAATIHAGAVCAYILHRWNSLFERTTADLYERCG